MCAHIHENEGCVWHAPWHIWTKGYLVGIDLPPPCGSHRLSSGCQPWWQSPNSELSRLPCVPSLHSEKIGILNACTGKGLWDCVPAGSEVFVAFILPLPLKPRCLLNLCSRTLYSSLCKFCTVVQEGGLFPREPQESTTPIICWSHACKTLALKEGIFLPLLRGLDPIKGMRVTLSWF